MKDKTLLDLTSRLKEQFSTAVWCDVQEFQGCSLRFNTRLRCHLTDLVARGSPLQQQSEAVGRLFVVFQTLAQAAVIILHQTPVHNHLELA